MVKIRLQRTGRHKLALYRVVVADSRSPRDGKVLEVLGTYDPNQSPAAVKVDIELIKSWLDKGAQLTPTVKNLLKGKL